MKRLIPFILLALTVSAHGTIAYVGSGKTTNTPSGKTTTETVTYPAVAGNTLYVWVYQTLAQSATITVDDNQTNTYNAIGSCIVSHSLVKGCMFRASNVVTNGGTFTITAHSSAISFKALMVLEFSGIDNSSPSDQITTLAGNSVTTPSPALTTANANDALISCNGDDNSNASVTHTAGTGYTKVQEETVGTTNFVGACEYKIVSSTGTYNGDWTISSASDGVLIHIAEKASAGAAPPGQTIRRAVISQ